ncbi:MAG: hypothetical protein CSB34_05565 [Desulfobulbus propionicus]|nr:MAG: hypothetical protein CSB34_05565 [Desulfobulbus propionicus]PIE66582.1 MAG: hypothetical protein CSA26_00185 [Desulfobacterales bacterium]
MNIDLRRSARKNDYLPISVNAVNGVDGSLISGPFSSRIIDLSTHGACLLMTQVLKERYHVFHSTQENQSYLLQLVLNIPPTLIDYTIDTRPVWFDSHRQKGINAFKLGVEFLVSPQGKKMKKIQTAVARNQKARGSWWTKASSE